MRFIYILIAIAAFAASSLAQTVLFEDDFEGSIRPEWQAWQGSLGDFRVVAGFAQKGNYSVSTLRQIDKGIYVDLGSAQSDTTYSGWFYDNGAQPYEFLLSVSAIYQSGTSANMLSIGVDTRQSITRYSLFAGHSSHDLSLMRSNGWHKVDLYAFGNETRVYIDDQFQESVSFANHWRYVYLYANGWEGQQPSEPGYWDNIKVYEGAPVPEPATIGLMAFSLAFIARRRRR